jgi:hypothetical protein
VPDLRRPVAGRVAAVVTERMRAIRDDEVVLDEGVFPRYQELALYCRSVVEGHPYDADALAYEVGRLDEALLADRVREEIRQDDPDTWTLDP